MAISSLLLLLADLSSTKIIETDVQVISYVTLLMHS